MVTLSTVRQSVQIDCVSATVDAPLDSLVHRLNLELGTHCVPSRPLPGLAYQHAGDLVTVGNIVRAKVMSGSAHEHPHVYAIGCESYDSPAVYEALRQQYTGRWAPSRLDVALDFWHPEAFDLVVPQFIAYATRHNLKLGQQGDWIRGQARTLYIGAKSSSALIRVYEFKACHGYGAECRIELQLRPKSKNKAFIATRTPTELLYSSDCINATLCALDLDVPEGVALSPGTRPPDDLDRKLNWLAAQALPALLRILADVGGDPVALLDRIMLRKAEIEAQRALLRSGTLSYTAPEMTHREST